MKIDLISASSKLWKVTAAVLLIGLSACGGDEVPSEPPTDSGGLGVTVSVKVEILDRAVALIATAKDAGSASVAAGNLDQLTKELSEIPGAARAVKGNGWKPGLGKLTAAAQAAIDNPEVGPILDPALRRFIGAARAVYQ